MSILCVTLMKAREVLSITVQVIWFEIFKEIKECSKHVILDLCSNLTCVSKFIAESNGNRIKGSLPIFAGVIRFILCTPVFCWFVFIRFFANIRNLYWRSYFLHLLLIRDALANYFILIQKTHIL